MQIILLFMINLYKILKSVPFDIFQFSSGFISDNDGQL